MQKPCFFNLKSSKAIIKWQLGVMVGSFLQINCMIEVAKIQKGAKMNISISESLQNSDSFLVN